MSGDEARKAWLAGVFDRAAATYDRVGASYHEHFGGELVGAAGIAPGAAVLDVACGVGAVLVPAATAAGAAGHVAGIDISAEMVAHAARRLSDLGHAADARVMDAEELAFADATFDVVLCAFGLFFFESPERAVAEFARVLRPDGTVAVSTWAEEDPRWAWEGDLLAGVTVARRAISRPFDTDDEVEAVLTHAGFAQVRSERSVFGMHLADEGQWWDWKWSYSLRGVLEQLDAATLDGLRAAAFDRMQALREPAGFPVRLTARLTTARKRA